MFIKNKIKLYIFDLDGVLLDSSKNMSLAWQDVKKKLNINIPFFEYKKHIGLPFFTILKNIGIKKDYFKIKKIYSKSSIQNFKKKTTLFKDTIKVINTLKRESKIAILTSKDTLRTNYILKKKKLKFDCVITSDNVKNGKPNKEGVLKILSKLKIKKENTVYIGDTKVDELTAKNAKISFLYANWGFGQKRKKSIKSLKDLINLN
jgi:HAD superfamily hydrolase (TIGR01549 family)